MGMIKFRIMVICGKEEGDGDWGKAHRALTESEAIMAKIFDKARLLVHGIYHIALMILSMKYSIIKIM